MTVASRWTFWATLVFASVMASIPQAPDLGVPIGDKLQHAAAFLVLGGLAALGYPNISGPKLFVGLIFFGAGIEVVQTIPSLGRDPSFHDWLVDVAAAGAAIYIFRLFPRPRVRKQQYRSVGRDDHSKN